MKAEILSATAFPAESASALRRLLIAAKGRSRGPYLWVTIVAAFVSLVSLMPLGFIAWISVQTGWETASKLIFRGRVGELLINTALLELCTLPLTIALSVALAWLTERTDLPGARFWSMLAVAPLAVPAFVHSYAWVSLAPSLHGLPGGVLVSVLAYFPFLYLPVAAQLRRLDPAIEDAAASLGLNPWQVFFRAVLPQLRLAICGGSLLVGLHLLAEYGLYVMIRFDTFSTAIVDQFQSAFNGPAANMLAGVLVSCCLLLLLIEAVLRGGERYARVGAGAARPADRRRLGRLLVPALALNAATAALAIGVPFVTLTRWLYIGGAEIWRIDLVGGAFVQTVILAIAGGMLATIAARAGLRSRRKAAPSPPTAPTMGRSRTMCRILPNSPLGSSSSSSSSWASPFRKTRATIRATTANRPNVTAAAPRGVSLRLSA